MVRTVYIKHENQLLQMKAHFPIGPSHILPRDRRPWSVIHCYTAGGRLTKRGLFLFLVNFWQQWIMPKWGWHWWAQQVSSAGRRHASIARRVGSGTLGSLLSKLQWWDKRDNRWVGCRRQDTQAIWESFFTTNVSSL